MQEIVINRCYGGFSLSRKAFLRLRELQQKDALDEPDWGEPWGDGSGVRKSFGGSGSFCRDIARNDPLLVQVIKELDTGADGRYSELKIIEIPNDMEWIVDEYDGLEWVAEKHQTWR